MQVARPAGRVAGGILGLIAGFLITSPSSVSALSTHLAGLGLLPVLTIVTPIQNQGVSGTVPFFVQADTSGIVSLQFRIDGQNLGTAITAGSCRASWDSTQFGDGLHTIQAVGIDEFGNTTMSQPATVLVNNHAMPSPPAPGPTPTPRPPPTPGPSPTPRPTPTPTPTPAPAPTPTPTPAPPPTLEPALRITHPVAGSSVTSAFEAAVVLAPEIIPVSVRLEIRQPSGQVALTWRIPARGNSNLLVFKPELWTLDNGPYDLVAVSDTLSSPPVRVNFWYGACGFRARNRSRPRQHYIPRRGGQRRAQNRVSRYHCKQPAVPDSC